MFAGSQFSTLYKSSNFGVNWAPVSLRDLGATTQSEARVSFIANSAGTNDTSDTMMVYLLGAALWTTSDGEKFTKVTTKVPSTFQTHPLVDGVALATYYDDPCSIYVMTNYGEKFTRVTSGRRATWIKTDAVCQLGRLRRRVY